MESSRLFSRVKLTNLDLLDKKKEYQDSVDQLRLLSTTFSFKDLVCEYKFDEYKQEHLTKSLKEQVNAIVYKHIGYDEFKDDVVKKSKEEVCENLKFGTGIINAGGLLPTVAATAEGFNTEKLMVIDSICKAAILWYIKKLTSC